MERSCVRIGNSNPVHSAKRRCVTSKLASTSQEVARGVGVLIGHLLALIVGVILMIAGAGMGVSLVLLPIGIPLGLVGLAIALWGLFGWAAEET
jgi:hypothetical protein